MEEEKEIKIIENPLQANGIDKLELEMGNDEAQELTRCRKCRILCGRESILVSMLVLVLGGGNIFIFLPQICSNINSRLEQQSKFVGCR